MQRSSQVVHSPYAQFDIQITFDYLAGRAGSTVPFSFAVSGPPSAFVDLSEELRSYGCLVSVFDKPSCFWELDPFGPGDLDWAAFNEC